MKPLVTAFLYLSNRFLFLFSGTVLRLLSWSLGHTRHNAVLGVFTVQDFFKWYISLTYECMRALTGVLMYFCLSTILTAYRGSPSVADNQSLCPAASSQSHLLHSAAFFPSGWLRAKGLNRCLYWSTERIMMTNGSRSCDHLPLTSPACVHVFNV